jgi:hypothetical protein
MAIPRNVRIQEREALGLAERRRLPRRIELCRAPKSLEPTSPSLP